MKLKQAVISLIVLMVSASGAGAQEASCGEGLLVGLRSNLLYDLALVPNVGAEVAIEGRWSAAIDLCGAWWGGPDHSRSWRIYGGELTGRYYFWPQRARMCGHHAGIYAQLYTYDFKLGDMGYIGGDAAMNIFHHPTAGAGLEYGYTLPVGRRVSLDFSLGIGWSGGRCTEYHTAEGRDLLLRTHTRNWFGPTRAAVSVVWHIGRGATRE